MSGRRKRGGISAGGRTAAVCSPPPTGGYRAIVDLGREKDLADPEIGRGDTIQIRGKHGTTSGQNVLIADRIRVDDETIDINRKKSRASEKPRSGERPSQKFSGKIRNHSRVNLDDDQREDHLIVRKITVEGEKTELRDSD